ncbi:neurogenic locus protein delta-like [Polistes fuscatus]|uniref:neurogenic locus protein delta-like n=1 Tax=Polistes fuscatus TaxID=30207 RepID=UPI001CA801E6|nr:neurogenic locus protein delta-like [Polistes fuscatus]
MWTMMLVWTVAAVLLPSPHVVNASGVFELRLKSFVNEYGKDSLGKCCSGTTSRTGECSGACKTRFRVCLKQYQVKIDTTTPCTYGDVVTPVLGENIVNLSPNVALPSFTNPIRFPFEFTWPGTFSLIVEAYHDSNNTTHHSLEKVLITRLTTQKWLDVGSEWIEEEHRSAHSRMVYEYRVTCAAHYYGKGCENLCRPRDDNFGHYSCSPTGERVCLSGWKGDYCATPRCLPGCDEQHGHCSQPNECNCHSGWEGAFCDQCVRYPECLHGSCQKPWECLCDEGWGGLFCNQDLNYCTNHKPCMNGGTCFNTGQGSYTCSCAPGFTGTDCQTPLLDCHSKPCLNGGSCSMEATYSNSSVSSGGGNNANGNHHHHLGSSSSLDSSSSSSKLQRAAYRCTCPPGWRGRHCEMTSRSCRDSPCLHGGICEDDSLNGYICRCPAGYAGTDCESQLDECSPNPCTNGGTCTDMVNNYRCTCPPGFAGDRCEINIDDCQGDPCLNGATCVDLVNRFRCQCVPGFVGRLCQDKVDYCLAKPCANGGRCISRTNDYRCECKPGFTGKDCSVDVDECLSAPCKNGGTCRNRVNGFLCECPKGWHGESCTEEVGFGGTAILPVASAASSSSESGTAILPAAAAAAAAVPPSGASYWSGNLSKHVTSAAEARDAGLTTEHVVVIATISTAVPAFVLVAALAVMCMKRRQKREQAKADEEARLQNERNAVHSSMSKRSGGVLGGGSNSVIGSTGGGSAVGIGNVGLLNGITGGCVGNGVTGGGIISGGGSISGSGLIGSAGGSVCTLGTGDAHMIKNTWTANKSVNNASSVRQDDLDSSFQTDVTLDSSCSGYKAEPVLQDGRTRTTKQLNTEAAAHRASHLFQKEKDCLGLGLGLGVAVLENAKKSSVFANTPSDACCAAEATLLKRPTTVTESSGPPGSGGGGGGGGVVDSACGVYVIDDHYRHDATTLATTLATEV